MEERGPDGSSFVVEEGNVDERAVLAQLGTVGRIVAQVRAAWPWNKHYRLKGPVN